jgi:hypothetical protein
MRVVAHLLIAALQALYLLIVWSSIRDFFFPSARIQDGTVPGGALVASGFAIGPLLLLATLAHARWMPSGSKIATLLRILRIAFVISATVAFATSAFLYFFG